MKLNRSKISENYSLKISAINYETVIKIEKFILLIGGYAYVTNGALVIVGNPSILINTILHIKKISINFEITSMCESYIGDFEDVIKSLLKEQRGEKINNLLNK